MSRPCVCGGSNETCCHCYGRGEIRDGFADALVIHSQSPRKVGGGKKTWKELKMRLDVLIRMLERRQSRLPRQVAKLNPREPDCHVRQLRPFTAVAPEPPSAGHDVLPSANDVLRESTTFAAPRDKNLDATKLYAHSYRETGRFGSHPSHDGFDDESGPD